MIFTNLYFCTSLAWFLQICDINSKFHTKTVTSKNRWRDRLTMNNQITSITTLKAEK